MSAEEFEASYASMAGITVERLHADGRSAELCGCDWPQCRGWVLGYRLVPDRVSSSAP